MDRRTLLKLLGGVAALPALGKAIKGTGIKSIKAAGKVLPKVQGMPEWFGPLVNKIMKEGVDISPKASRVEEIVTVKKLEIPSGDVKPDIITMSKFPDGSIKVEADVYGGAFDTPFELNYKPPKTDIDVATGKVIKEPGDFSVVEQRPRPVYDPDGADFEIDYENMSINDAISDIERIEKIATGKKVDPKKIQQREKARNFVQDNPYDDISNRYPEPDYYSEPDYADGGIASFAYGGLTKTVPPAKGPDSQGVETLFIKRYS